jgi:hypothetical protein
VARALLRILSVITRSHRSSRLVCPDVLQAERALLPSTDAAAGLQPEVTLPIMSAFLDRFFQRRSLQRAVELISCFKQVAVQTLPKQTWPASVTRSTPPASKSACYWLRPK